MDAERTHSIIRIILGAAAGAAVFAVLNRYWDDDQGWKRTLLGSIEFFIVMLIVFLALMLIRRRRSSRE